LHLFLLFNEWNYAMGFFKCLSNSVHFCNFIGIPN
jgi:hypothetical protein